MNRRKETSQTADRKFDTHFSWANSLIPERKRSLQVSLEFYTSYKHSLKIKLFTIEKRKVCGARNQIAHRNSTQTSSSYITTTYKTTTCNSFAFSFLFFFLMNRYEKRGHQNRINIRSRTAQKTRHSYFTFLRQSSRYVQNKI